MMKSKKTQFILLLLLLYVNHFSQMTSDSLSSFFISPKPSTFFLGSDKNINTLNVNSNFYINSYLSNFNFAIDGKFNSAFLTTSQKIYRNSHSLKLSMDYSIYDFFSPGLLVYRHYYSDNNQNSLSNIEENKFLFFSKLNYEQFLEFSPFWGKSQNKQYAIIDDGEILGFEGKLENIEFENIRIKSNFQYLDENISPRFDFIRDANLAINTQNSEIFSNKLEISYLERNKDFYKSTDSSTAIHFDILNNIESRIEQKTLIENKLNLYFGNSSHFEVVGSVNFENVERKKKYIFTEIATSSTFDPKIDKLQLNFMGNYYYNSSDFSYYFRSNFQNREEIFSVNPIDGIDEIFFSQRQETEHKKDNNSKLYLLSSGTEISISQNNKIGFSLLHRKLIYNTPSDDNYDDRDELLSMGKLSFLKRFSHFFDWNISLEGSFNHIVYIYSERSSNNNIKRILKLSTDSYYHGKIVRSQNSAEVLANYTVYDYETFSGNLKSFAFRQFVFRDSTFIKFTNNWEFGSETYLKLSEQGQFSWNDFAQKPSQYIQEVFTEPKVIYNNSTFFAGVGIRLFSLSNYQFEKMNKKMESDYLSVGPSFEASLQLFDSISSKFYGWYENIYKDSQFDKNLLNFNFTLSWKI